MSIENEFSIRDVSSGQAPVTAQARETLIYVTDLLDQLQTISNVSGLSEMANDLSALLAKHMLSSDAISQKFSR